VRFTKFKFFKRLLASGSTQSLRRNQKGDIVHPALLFLAEPLHSHKIFLVSYWVRLRNAPFSKNLLNCILI